MPEMPVEERGGGIPGWVWVVVALVVLAILAFLFIPGLNITATGM